MATDTRSRKELLSEIETLRLRVEEAEDILQAISIGESEEALRFALDAAKMGIFDWNVTFDQITWSQPTSELFGFRSGNFGATYAEFLSRVHPEDQPLVEKAIALSKTARVPYTCEYRIVQPDGYIRWLFARGEFTYDSDGQPTRMRGTVVDITEGKQTENKLWESQIKLEAALNSMSDAVFISNKEGRFIDVNEAFASFHKFRNKAECPKTLAEYSAILDMFMADGEPVPLEQWAVSKALRGESGSNTEYTLRRKDTDETWVGSYNFGPIYDNHGQIVGSVVTVRDITEQKRNEKSFREVEAHRVASFYSRSLIETSLDPLVTISPEGIITDVNAATEAVTGFPRDKLIGTEFADYFTDTMLARAGYQEVFNFGMVRDYELAIRHRDGHLIPVIYNASLYRDETGKVMGVFAAARDITRRKLVEAELAHAHNLLVTIINALPIRVFWKDLNLRYLGCNASFAHDTGFEQPDDIIGKDDTQLSWAEHAELFQRDDRAVMESGISKLDFEEPLMTANGQSIWLHTSKVPLINKDNEIFGVLGIYEDVTEHKRAHGQLEKLMSEQQAMLDNELVGIVRSRDRRIVWNNKAMERIFGYEPGELDGQMLRIFYSDDASFKVHGEAVYALLNSHGSYRAQVEMVRKDGEKIWIDINGANLSGTADEFLWLLADITPIKKYQDKIEQVAFHDILTGLPNRLLVSDRLKQALAQAERAEQSLAVCYLDLDGFKPVNDSLGHEAGDKLLIEISRRLQTSVRANDTVGRLGGDEFVLLLTNLENTYEVYEVLQRVMEGIAQPVMIDETHEMNVTASIGIALFPQDSNDPDTLLRHADQAMYVAKESGKNRYFLFNIEQDATMKAEQDIMAGILRGLDRNEFVLYYQPKVNMKTGAVVGAEALIRWQHPEQGLLLPSAFLPIVEVHPCGVELGEWVIDAVFAQVTEWHEQNFDIPVSVNIGTHHLHQDGFVRGLRERFVAHPDVQPGHIELEIVESSAMENFGNALQSLQACNEIGLQFSIDDFGTGYSSLTYLKRLPVNILKIDQSFVREMLNDPEDQSIIEGVIGLAKAFHYEVIAEGVETASHGERLLALGCDLAQGYAIARPMLGAELPGWVATWQQNAVGMGRRDRTQNPKEC